MMRDCELRCMSLDQLHGIRSVLERSSDPCAPVALRMVEREMRLKRRSIMEHATTSAFSSQDCSDLKPAP